MILPAVDRLPEELLLLIFECLEPEHAPSERKIRQEPGLNLTKGATHTVKDISRVSRRWRRIVKPLLFSHSRLQLDQLPRPEWTQCSICGDGPDAGCQQLQGDDEAYHAELDKDTERRIFNEIDGYGLQASLRLESLCWARRMFHGMLDYLGFVRDNGLASYIRSVVLTMRCLHFYNSPRLPHERAAKIDLRYRVGAVIWQMLYEVTSPARVVILAPPADLACLTNCAIDLFDDWAFTDMDYHILELRIDGRITSPDPAKRTRLAVWDHVPYKHSAAANSSILHIRPWTHLGLNEGSFLQAYGTYEYFERGPPSLIFSIKDCVKSTMSEGIFGGLAALRSFSYTAIFPFATHLDLRWMLPQLEELDVQLAPGPESNILNDKQRIGKAELEDCWQEFFSAYRFLTRPLRTFNIGPDGTPKLRKFVCRDVQIPMVQVDLDDEFTPLCLPVWGEHEPGVFTRLCDQASYDWNASSDD